MGDEWERHEFHEWPCHVRVADHLHRLALDRSKCREDIGVTRVRDVAEVEHDLEDEPGNRHCLRVGRSVEKLNPAGFQGMTTEVR